MVLGCVGALARNSVRMYQMYRMSSLEIVHEYAGSMRQDSHEQNWPLIDSRMFSIYAEDNCLHVYVLGSAVRRAMAVFCRRTISPIPHL